MSFLGGIFEASPLKKMQLDPDQLVVEAGDCLDRAEVLRDKEEFVVAFTQASIASGKIALAQYLREHRP